MSPKHITQQRASPRYLLIATEENLNLLVKVVSAYALCGLAMGLVSYFYFAKFLSEEPTDLAMLQQGNNQMAAIK